MMTKKNTSSIMAGVYLLMVPACAIMLMSFGNNKQNVVESKISHAAQNITAQNIPDIAPVDLTKVTKVVLFGDILDPRTNQMRNHTGIDFQLSAGSDVIATGDGVVIMQRCDDNRGNFVIIGHSEMYSTRYFHLETALVKKGDRIAKARY